MKISFPKPAGLLGRNQKSEIVFEVWPGIGVKWLVFWSNAWV